MSRAWLPQTLLAVREPSLLKEFLAFFVNHHSSLAINDLMIPLRLICASYVFFFHSKYPNVFLNFADNNSPRTSIAGVSDSVPGTPTGVQTHHTMEFFEMCAALISQLARWFSNRSVNDCFNWFASPDYTQSLQYRWGNGYFWIFFVVQYFDMDRPH